MPPFGPIKRDELIYYLRRCGFEGPDLREAGIDRQVWRKLR
jgi:hypothetical protein